MSPLQKPPTQIAIVDTTHNHLKRLIALEKATFSSADEFSEADFIDHINNAFFNKVIIDSSIPDNDENPILANLIASSITIGDEQSVYIDSIAVSELYRKQGAATKLFQQLVDTINLHNQTHKNNQFKTVSLDVSCDNIAGKTLYEKLGFKIFTNDLSEPGKIFMAVSLDTLKLKLAEINT